MPSIGARGPSREGYLKMRGPNLRLENTSLHREDFVRVDKLHALRSESQRVDVDQMGLHRCHRSSQVGALDELRSEPAKLLFGRPIGWAVRPRVIINAAMSVDGKIALPDGKGVRLSNEEDLRRVHRLRAAVDAIIVGVGTVLKDDPKLTVKSEYAKGRNPLRVFLYSDDKIADFPD